MTGRPATRFGGVILLLGFLACFAPAVAIQHRAVQRVPYNKPFWETWQLQGKSGDVMRVLALRYDLVAADFLWLRSIQSFGGRGMTNRDWRPMYNMFDTITELDPYFEAAYTFGNLVVGDEGGRQSEGLGLLNKGTFKLFKQYRVPFEGMYVAHWSMHDATLARWYGRLASKRKDAPEWVPRITAYIDVEAGEYYLGLSRYVGNLLRSIDERQASMQTVALEKSMEAIDKWNGSVLAKALDEYTTRTHHLPSTMEDLASMPALQNYESADMVKLLTAVERRAIAAGVDPADAIKIDLIRDKPLIIQGLANAMAAAGPSPPKPAGPKLEGLQTEVFQEALTKRTGLPPDPYGRGYVLNTTGLRNPQSTASDIFQPQKKAAEARTDQLNGFRSAVIQRREQLGRNPKDLHEVFLQDYIPADPFGKPFVYDAAKGDMQGDEPPAN